MKFLICVMLLSATNVIAKDFEVDARISFTPAIAIDSSEIENSSLPEGTFTIEVDDTRTTIVIQ